MNYLLERDGVSVQEVAEGTGLAVDTLDRLFRGTYKRKVTNQTIDLIADFFLVNADALKKGYVAYAVVSPKIWDAYDKVAKCFAVNGQFHSFPLKENVVPDLERFIEVSFSKPSLNLREREILFSLLNGRYIIRSKQNKYYRIALHDREFETYFSILQGIAVAVLQDLRTFLRRMLLTFQATLNSMIDCESIEVFLMLQTQMVDAFTYSNKHAHIWAKECYNLAYPRFDAIRSSIKSFEIFKQNMMHPLILMDGFIKSGSLDSDQFGNLVGAYFSNLGTIRG